MGMRARTSYARGAHPGSCVYGNGGDARGSAAEVGGTFAGWYRVRIDMRAHGVVRSE